jgi:transcription elongation factor GreA
MTRRDYTRLQNELSALRSRCSVEVPDDFMDYDANLIARRSARQSRIREIENMLANAIVDGKPAGDLVAAPGMVLTIRYDDTGETETFLQTWHRRRQHHRLLDGIAPGPLDRRCSTWRPAHLLNSP